MHFWKFWVYADCNKTFYLYLYSHTYCIFRITVWLYHFLLSLSDYMEIDLTN